MSGNPGRLAVETAAINAARSVSGSNASKRTITVPGMKSPELLIAQQRERDLELVRTASAARRATPEQPVAEPTQAAKRAKATAELAEASAAMAEQARAYEESQARFRVLQEAAAEPESDDDPTAGATNPDDGLAQPVAAIAQAMGLPMEDAAGLGAMVQHLVSLSMARGRSTARSDSRPCSPEPAPRPRSPPRLSTSPAHRHSHKEEVADSLSAARRRGDPLCPILYEGAPAHPPAVVLAPTIPPSAPMVRGYAFRLTRKFSGDPGDSPRDFLRASEIEFDAEQEARDRWRVQGVMALSSERTWNWWHSLPSETQSGDWAEFSHVLIRDFAPLDSITEEKAKLQKLAMKAATFQELLSYNNSFAEILQRVASPRPRVRGGRLHPRIGAGPQRAIGGNRLRREAPRHGPASVAGHCRSRARQVGVRPPQGCQRRGGGAPTGRPTGRPPATTRRADRDHRAPDAARRRYVHVPDRPR